MNDNAIQTAHALDFYAANQPSALKAVRDLLAAGQTPAQIESHVKRIGGNQTARNFFHLAEYLLTSDHSTPKEG